MQRRSENVAKACESCRRAKVKCSGQEPCQRCHNYNRPSSCIYRHQIRTRKKRHSSLTTGPAPEAPASATGIAAPGASITACNESTVDGSRSGIQSPSPSSGRDQQNVNREAADAESNVRSQTYHGITASNSDSISSAGIGENTQLFYGPSSNFAFLQQIHRALFLNPHGQPADSDVQEAGRGLDMFMQKSIFFGTPSRVDTEVLYRQSNAPIETALPLAQALTFLGHFIETSGRLFPFLPDSELHEIIHRLYNNNNNNNNKDLRPSISPQVKALGLAILADGALCTPQTDLAEMLMLQAKQTAAPYDDAVTLPMIQYSLVVADYQLHMGRPNSSYIHLGAACRKAIAMGLHKEAANIMVRPEDLQKQRITIWCLYFHESWQALGLGRSSTLRKRDITSPFPNKQPVLVGLCRLAHIAENTADAIYCRRYGSLRQLYVAAEGILSDLHRFAEQMGIGGVHTSSPRVIDDDVALMQLHNFYYHGIILAFRPFLIAELALKTAGSLQACQEEQMWLRQACRQATDAAQDQIVYMSHKFQTDPRCKTIRFTAFFLESSSAVLMFDMLCIPSKRAYNLESIQLAIQCIKTMVDDEPVVNSSRSLQHILCVVEAAITKRPGLESSSGGPQISLVDSPALELTDLTQINHHSSVQFPPLTHSSSAASEQMIYFSDLPNGEAQEQGSGSTAKPISPLSTSGLPGADMQMMLNMHLDVLTTDLFSFFPMDMTTPPSQGYNVTVDRDADDFDAQWLGV